jgi:ribosomal protein S18 acetylase RimI-like enzyme
MNETEPPGETSRTPPSAEPPAPDLLDRPSTDSQQPLRKHAVEPALRESTPPGAAAAQHPAIILRAGTERVDELEPIYRDQHRHYAAIAPELAGHPPRSEQESWQARRERYLQWLATPGAFLLVAEHDAKIVGYALLSPGLGMQAWQTAPRIGDLHDLAVAASERGQGIGTRLLHAVKAELVAQGITELRLNVTASNDHARRLYERHGLQVITHIMLGPVNSPLR